jgi:hypothetical protein
VAERHARPDGIGRLLAYGPNGDRDLAGFEPLDMHDSFGSRDRWRRAVCGEPPWKPCQLADHDADDAAEFDDAS